MLSKEINSPKLFETSSVLDSSLGSTMTYFNPSSIVLRRLKSPMQDLQALLQNVRVTLDRPSEYTVRDAVHFPSMLVNITNNPIGKNRIPKHAG